MHIEIVHPSRMCMPSKTCCQQLLIHVLLIKIYLLSASALCWPAHATIAILHALRQAANLAHSRLHCPDYGNSWVVVKIQPLPTRMHLLIRAQGGVSLHQPINPAVGRLNCLLRVDP